MNDLREEAKYSVDIKNFTGPLDLLCFLISKNQMNIFDVSLSELTDKYIAYINEMQSMNMEIATEFLLMAATLLYIKSKKLLPSENKNEQQEDEQAAEELLKKITEYKLYKDKQEILKQMYLKNFGSYTKLPDKLKFKAKYECHINANDIANAYGEIIKRNTRAKNEQAKRIDELATYDRVTVKSKVKQILGVLRKKASFVFSTLFSKGTTKLDIVTSFLGVLELSKLNQVQVFQREMYGDIVVKKTDEFCEKSLSINE